MDLNLQTDGHVVVGVLPNDGHYPCLVCGCIPDTVWSDLFVPEPKDIPSSVPLPDSKNFAMLYRLCPRCHELNPPLWKIRVLVLERLNILAGLS